MKQNALTVVTPVKPDKVADLNTLLTTLGTSDGDAATKNPSLVSPLQFSKIPTIHFACLQVVDNDPRYVPILLFELSYDGETEALFDAIQKELAEPLLAVYNLCVNFPAAENRSATTVRDYVRKHVVPTAAFYVGCPDQTVQSIHNAIAVRKNVEAFLDSPEGRTMAKTMNALQMLQQIQQHLTGPDGVKPEVSEITLEGQEIRAWIRMTLIVLVAIPIVIVLLPLIIVLVIYLRLLELREERRPEQPSPPIDPRLLKPDIHTQTHLTTLVDVKPGKFRVYVLKFVLWSTNLLATKFYTSGELLGIPTIHFARWALLDNDQRLLFFSNYDGSWASYLGDFVDRAAWGLTAVWGGTEGFPPPKFLVFGGAREIEPFKRWSREHNIWAPVWYSAYLNETLRNLRKDIEFRDTVGKQLNAEEAATLLQLL